MNACTSTLPAMASRRVRRPTRRCSQLRHSSDDRTHIAAYRYAAKIANAGFFDEIVLVMDCCQDVLKAAVAEAILVPA
ncbi:MAG: hypothetical protein MZW92_31595 [Comamonadaceae bacterium]|nr:hypothetical protein [Comamonadaceae bacterium]